MNHFMKRKQYTTSGKVFYYNLLVNYNTTSELQNEKRSRNNENETQIHSQCK